MAKTSNGASPPAPQSAHRIGLSATKNWQIVVTVLIPVLLAGVVFLVVKHHNPVSPSPEKSVGAPVASASVSQTADESPATPLPPAEPPPPSHKAEPIFAKEPPPRAPEPVSEMATNSVAETSTKVVTAAPPPEAAKAEPINHALAETARAESPKEEPKLEHIEPRKNGEEIKLNDPEGAYSVGALLNRTRLKLTGQVNLLRVERVDGEAVLDASGLRAKEIVFTGALNGRARVKVFAPEGKVELREEINGSATVEINAPGGTVIVGEAARTCINGATRLRITAAEVDLRGKANGAPRIEVTLSRGGKLKFTELAGAARIDYRRTAPDDPEPTIKRGRIIAGARVAQRQN